jgi:predicted dehydrogenase
VDDLSWAFVRFDNGAVIQLQVSWAVNNKEQFYTEIYGSQGGAWVGDQDKVELYTTLNGQQSDVQVTVPRSGIGSYKHLTNNLVRHLEGDPTAEIVTPHQALTSVKIIEGVLRSATEGREVVLDRS